MSRLSDEVERNNAIEILPGTLHLIDLEGHMQAKHSRGQKDVVLVPAPSVSV